MKLEIISKHPAGPAHATPLLFVHGACHAAWCWDVHFLDYFAEHGYSAHALSLREHGHSEGHGRLRWTRIAEYVEDVSHAAGQLHGPPVLIGHSMGGFVVQKFLEDYPAPAAVLLASAPPGGVLASMLGIAGRHPLVFAKVNLTLSWLPLVGNPALLREYLFAADLPEDQFAASAKQLQDESFLAVLDMLALNLPRPEKVKTPLLILGGARDNFFRPDEVEATARAYHTSYEIFPDMAHEMMLDPRWQTPARRILSWLEEREKTQTYLGS